MYTNPKFMALLDDKDFVIEMMSQETPEDVQKIFSERGVEFSLDEINALGEALAKVEASGVKDEFNEEDLENVSGGIVITTATLIAAGKIIVAVGGAALSIYKWYKSRK